MMNLICLAEVVECEQCHQDIEVDEMAYSVREDEALHTVCYDMMAEDMHEADPDA